MAVSAPGKHAGQIKDELFLSNDAVSVCLLVNRRARAMRIIDFRAGPSGKKRETVLQAARKERMEKVYTLVERDEVGTWMKLGFTKEGSIPGFYKRSDAYLLGCNASAPGAVPVSEMRIAVRPAVQSNISDASATARLAPELLVAAPFDEDDEGGQATSAAVTNRAEKTLARAKRNAKLLTEKPLPRAAVAEVRESDVKKSVDRAVKSGVALTAFERFGRNVSRRFFTASARGKFELALSVEEQASFNNGFLELLTAPKNDAEAAATTASVQGLCDLLKGEGVVSLFSLVPSDDVMLATCFVASGFRRTGVLENHLVIGDDEGVRKDAILFSKKLATPAGE